MINQVVLVGRVVGNINCMMTENGMRKATMTLAIPRSYKNAEGIYDTDFIEVVLWNGVADNTTECVQRGDLVGVKGRLESLDYIDEFDNNKIKTKMIMVADKVTFLSTR